MYLFLFRCDINSVVLQKYQMFVWSEPKDSSLIWPGVSRAATFAQKSQREIKEPWNLCGRKKGAWARS